MGKLTVYGVKAAKTPGTYQDGDGLMLVVKASGSRSWLVRVQADGRRRDFGLGSAKVVSLADAREKAAEVRKLYKDGIDPVAKRKADRMAQTVLPTFKAAAEDAHKELVAGWRNKKHQADWLSSLKSYAFPYIGDTRIDKLDAPAVRDLLLPIWLEKPETARRVRQRVRGVIDWAAAKGYRPALDLSGIRKGLPKQPRSDNHFAAMPYEDIPAFFKRLATADETVGRLALQFTILTAGRSGETRGATWAEVDLEERRWTIPASRMKAGKEHVVPLSDAALVILKKAAGFGKSAKATIFPGKAKRPLSDMTLSKIMRDMELPYTVHGFRSSFKDWASECTSFPDAVSEAALAHLDANKVRAAYRRTDFMQMRTKLMDAWASHCALGKPTIETLEIAG